MKNYIGVAVALALVGSADATDSTGTNPVCCQSLAHNFPSIYYGPSSADYTRLINARWSDTSILKPGCVVTPKSALDVSKIVKALTKYQCKFAVKSGGHNANPGANSINGGVSIDLGSLNSATLAADRSYVTLGAGLSWGKAYDIFNGSNIGFTGGICEDVGIGGVSLGGGQNLFQAQRGWVVDNLLGYEVVLASGDVVNANSKSYSDLFKALKGGNTNFGIVTGVKLASFEFEGLWGGELLVNLTGPQSPRSKLLDTISQATVDITSSNQLDPYTAVQTMNAYLAGTGGQIFISAFANTKGIEKPKAVQAFLNLPNQLVNTGRHAKLADFVKEVSKFQPKGYREVTASITITNDFKTLREIWDATDAVYNAIPHKSKIDWLVSFIPQPKIQQSFSNKNCGGNSLGLSNVKNDQLVIWLTSRWTDASLDGEMNEARKKFISAATDVAKKHGAFHPFIYINYAAPTQDPLCGYGAESFAFLKKTAKKYDPKGVFQTLMPGGFKLDKSTCV